MLTRFRRQSASPLVSLQISSNTATPYAVDRVFQTLSEVNQAGLAFQGAGNSKPVSSEMTRGDRAADTDSLQSAGPQLSSDSKIATDLDAMDGYFAQVADADTMDSD